MNGLSRRRAAVLAVAMGAAAVAAGFASPIRRQDDRDPLDLEATFPREFAGWRVDPASAAFVRAPDALSRKLYQQLLERVYIDGYGRRVMLSVAYGREQASDLALHWPEVCYRYGGYTVGGREVTRIPVSGRSVQVTRIVAELPGRPEPVTYWSVIGGERAPDASTFRLRRLGHAVRREVADGLLVRVSSLDPDHARGFALQAEFIDAMVRSLGTRERLAIEGVEPAA